MQTLRHKKARINGLECSERYSLWLMGLSDIVYRAKDDKASIDHKLNLMQALSHINRLIRTPLDYLTAVMGFTTATITLGRPILARAILNCWQCCPLVPSALDALLGCLFRLFWSIALIMGDLLVPSNTLNQRPCFVSRGESGVTDYFIRRHDENV